MSNFDLIWKTFEFHSFEGSKLEEKHYANMLKIQSFKEKGFGSEKNLPSLKRKMLKDITILNNCYSKQLDSINELINIHDSKTFPKGMEISKETLYSLKNLIVSLLEETKIYYSDVEDFLS